MTDFIKTLDNGSKLCRACYVYGRTENAIKHKHHCMYMAWRVYRAKK